MALFDHRNETAKEIVLDVAYILGSVNEDADCLNILCNFLDSHRDREQLRNQLATFCEGYLKDCVGAIKEDLASRRKKMPNFRAVPDECTDSIVTIRDIGPWDKYPTVTNAAEAVVEYFEKQNLLQGKRLFYYDSDGRADEILVKNGKFAGFAPGPR